MKTSKNRHNDKGYAIV